MVDGEVLVVKNLSVEAANKTVLKAVSLKLVEGEVVALTGVNGSGKSSLAMTLMGHSSYSVVPTAGTKILFDGKNLLTMSVDERARAGLFVAWQNPISLPGVSVFSLAKTAYELRGKKITTLVDFKLQIENLLSRVGLTKEVVSRSINEGFSGGEKKRLELFWILLLDPRLVIMDELDSGLDVSGRELVAEIVSELAAKKCTVIVISHYLEFLSQFKPDRVVEIKGGQVIKDNKVKNEQG